MIHKRNRLNPVTWCNCLLDRALFFLSGIRSLLERWTKLYWNRDGFVGLILPPFLIEDGPFTLGCMHVPPRVGVKEAEDAISYAWRCRVAVWRPRNKSIPVQLKNFGFPFVGHLVVKIQRKETISLALFCPSSLVQQEVVTDEVVEVQNSWGTLVCAAPRARKAHAGSKAYCFPCTINLSPHPKT